MPNSCSNLRRWLGWFLLGIFLACSSMTPMSSTRAKRHLISLPSPPEVGSTRRMNFKVQERVQVGENTESLATNAVKQNMPIEPRQQTLREPWRASYTVSKKTQSEIQHAAMDSGNQKRPGITRASAVLQTLLQIPAERCNAANLVCALTLSAKAMGSFSAITNDNFRSLLFQVLHILHDLVEQRLLSSRQLCNAIWAIGKHYDRDPSLLRAEPSIVENIPSMQGFVVEKWNLKEEDDDKELIQNKLVDATVEAIARQLTDILARESAAATEQGDREQIGLRETKLGELCMVTWAYGILRPRRQPPGWLRPPRMGNLQPFLGKIESKRRKDFITFEKWTMNEIPQNDAESASGPTEAADELFDAIGEALCRLSTESAPFNTTNSIHDSPYGRMRLTECSWSEIANIAWAFEKRGRCLSPASETLLRALAREASTRLRSGCPETQPMLSRDISQLIWALGTIQQDNFRLAHDLVALVDDVSHYMGLKSHKNAKNYAPPFEKWSCTDIVQTVLSLAHARIDDSQLLLTLFKEAHLRLTDGLTDGLSTESRQEHGRKRFLAWEVCVLLWAQARLYLTPSSGAVYQQFPQTAVTRIMAAAAAKRLVDVGIGPQEQANIAWSLTVLGHYQSGEAIHLLRRTFDEAARSCEEEGLIQLEHAHQLWQAFFILEDESPQTVDAVPKWFRGALSEKWNLEKSTKKTSSARHKSISQLLDMMGVGHYNEHDEDIDLAIVLKRQASWAHQTVAGERSDAFKVAVEFDGPNHFTRTTRPRAGETKVEPVRALGSTVLKYRLLKRKGWTVVRVPYYEFDKIPFWASMERQRYLQRLLKTHANIRFSDVDVSEYCAIPPNRKSRFD